MNALYAQSKVRWTLAISLVFGMASFPMVHNTDLNSTVDNQLNTSPASAEDVRTDSTSEEAGSYLSHEFGYAIIPREHPDSWQDAMYILHPDDPLPHDGYVTEWNLYANYSANLTLAIFRHDEHNSVVGSHLLIGYNNVTMNHPGPHKFRIAPEHQIRFKEGDLIGVYFEGTNPIPFTKGHDTDCKTRTMYIKQPCDFNVCRTYVFRQKKDGWNPCRIYSISAHIVNESSEIGHGITKYPLNDGQTENPTPPGAVIIEPDSFEVKLFHGRSTNEGLVLVRPPGGQWGSVCDDGWDDADATVVCRELGFRAGYARFYPYFGKTNVSLPIYIDDVQCVGTEPTLSSCQRQTGWRQHNCQHAEDAGVQCIVNQADEKQHYFGYPAVLRSQIDRWQRGVYIPHPHQQLPWRKGTINSWHVYLQADPGSKISITLQVWRLKGQLAYMLVGQTILTGLDEGFHEKYLTGREAIEFEAGDVVGLQFDNINPVPYDLRQKSCSNDEKVLYLVRKDMHNNPVLHEGAVYGFQEKPDTWKACRMYSLFAQYSGEASQGNFAFDWWHSQYKVIVNKVDTAFGALHRCQQELGPRASLARITHEDELLMITRALTSLQLDFNRAMWIAGSHRDAGLVTKWAECEPARGKECIVLKKQYATETYSTDEYYMYAENCHQAHYFVCELEHDAPENPNDTPESKISLQSMKRPLSPFTTLSPVTVIRSPSRDLHKGVVAAVVMVTISSVVILSLVVIFLYRRRKRRQFCPSENDESTVRFVSLHDKAPM